MGGLPKFASESQIKSLGEGIQYYLKLFALLNLGEFLLYILWVIVHSPLAIQKLNARELLRNAQIWDFTIQSLVLIIWVAYFYFLIKFLKTLYPEIKKSQTYFFWIIICFSVLFIAQFIELIFQGFKIWNYIQYYSAVRQTVNEVTPTVGELYGLLINFESIMSLSAKLLIIPASINCFGAIFGIIWAKKIQALNLRSFSFSDGLTGFGLIFLGYILVFLEKILYAHPTIPIVWFYIAGTILIIVGLNKVATSLSLFSYR